MGIIISILIIGLLFFIKFGIEKTYNVKNENGEYILNNVEDYKEKLLPFKYGEYTVEEYFKIKLNNKVKFNKIIKYTYDKNSCEEYAKDKNIEVFNYISVIAKEDSPEKKTINRKFSYEDIIDSEFGEYKIKVCTTNKFNDEITLEKEENIMHTLMTKNQYLMQKENDKDNRSNKEYSKDMKEKGEYTEWLIEKQILEVLNGEYYKVLHNVYLPKSSNEEETTEVDVILICKKGIYVIEAKNYSGKIYGKFNSVYWTEYFRKSKYKFYNPIKQNRIHINALKKLIKEDNIFSSYIVFGKDADLRKIPYSSEGIKILDCTCLEDTLKKDLDSKNKIFNTEKVNLIYDYLNEFSNASQDVKDKHVEKIKERYR